MKRKVLIIACLLASPALLIAQKKKKGTDRPINYSGKGLTIPGTAFLFPESNEPEVKFDYKQPGAPLPAFRVINKDSKDITGDLVKNGSNLFVIVFNPTCEHCEEETQLLHKNVFLFKGSKVLMIAAPIMTEHLSFFDGNVHISEYPSTFTVSVDSARIQDKIFNYTQLPQINIYSGKEGRLLKTFNGYVPIDSLKPFIQ